MERRHSTARPARVYLGSMSSVKKVKELISVTNRLEQVGIEGSKISIPKIVVIGDQSAGKSSIIEAISEIQVPRSGGTCTRCPIQINLTNDPHNDWSCQLKIHKKFDYFSPSSFRGRPKSPWHVKDQPMDVWTAKVDRTNLSTLLHRAQIAVLNPNQSPGDIMNGVAVHQDLTQFSPNIVQLDISGPSLPTLTFTTCRESSTSPKQRTQTRHIYQPWFENSRKNTLLPLALLLSSRVPWAWTRQPRARVPW